MFGSPTHPPTQGTHKAGVLLKTPPTQSKPALRREPSLWWGVPQAHAHVLDVQELGEAILAVLPAQARLLHATKGSNLAGDGNLVHTNLGAFRKGGKEGMSCHVS